MVLSHVRSTNDEEDGSWLTYGRAAQHANDLARRTAVVRDRQDVTRVRERGADRVAACSAGYDEVRRGVAGAAVASEGLRRALRLGLGHRRRLTQRPLWRGDV